MEHAAMDTTYPAALAAALAARLRAAREELVRRWLERITARVSLSPNRVFPTEALLNHVPLLVDGIADYLADSTSELGAEAPVIAKAMELGELRHGQGFDAYEILKEHELLSGVLHTFLLDAVRELAGGEQPAAAGDVLLCWQRVSHGLELIRQATLTHFLRLAHERVRAREDQLRRFNRMVSHELKNRVGAIQGAAALLPEPWLPAAERERFVRMVVENADGLQHVLENLEALSRIESESRQRRNVLLPQAAQEAVRQLRASAASRKVEIRIPEDLPTVEVDAAAVELCLVNYLSNAIKYADPAKAVRWASVEGELRFGVKTEAAPEPGSELVVRVRDNGLGVPREARARLFAQFYRAHDETVTSVEGSGLGLSIVRETVESLGGRAWAEFPDEGGAVFAFSLPSRRDEDAAAAGIRRLEGGIA